MPSLSEILSNPEISKGLAEAWRESAPGLMGGHEEGGFVTLRDDGELQLQRWPRGAGDLIDVPDHADCRFQGDTIILSFHTHPNTGPDYLQEPSETDKRGVRTDPDLKAPDYVGELVISERLIYLVQQDGTVSNIGPTNEILL